MEQVDYMIDGILIETNNPSNTEERFAEMQVAFIERKEEEKC